MGMTNNFGPDGSESNPIKVQHETPRAAEGLEYGERPYLWVITPSGQRVKCYRSYSDYCDD